MAYKLHCRSASWSSKPSKAGHVAALQGEPQVSYGRPICGQNMDGVHPTSNLSDRVATGMAGAGQHTWTDTPKPW